MSIAVPRVTELAPLDVTVNSLVDSTARTATADGTGTGTIADGTDFVTVTCDDADKIIVLPTPTPGQLVTIVNGATGYELRSSDPETVGINGGTEALAESAIAANTVVWAFCASETNWICWSRIADGTLSVVQVAAAA